MSKKNNDGYTYVTIESAESGWILREPNKTTKIFVRWDRLVEAIELSLTNKGVKE